MLAQLAIGQAIATITLDSPHNRNALSAALMEQLSSYLAQACADQTVRAIVLTHTGSTFCAGADLSDAGDGVRAGLTRLLELLQAMTQAPKPIVGLVNGHVRAGGMGLVGACDIVIASPSASFAFTEARLGLAASVISLTTLPRMADRLASRYLLTGEVFDGPAAVVAGLITEAPSDAPAALQTVLDSIRGCSAGLGRLQTACHRCGARGVARARPAADRPLRATVHLRGRAGGHAVLPAEAPAELGGEPVTVAAGRLPQQDRSRATRRRLLEAAVECLAERGWSGTTVLVVAERAGVSRGAAQHHFPTREALVAGTIEHMSELRRAGIAARHAVDHSTVEVLELLFGFYSGPVFRAALALWVAAAADDGLRALIGPLEADLGRQAHRMAVALLRVDERAPGVREIIQATLDLMRGLGLADLLRDDSRRRNRVLRQWARMLDSTLRPG